MHIECNYAFSSKRKKDEQQNEHCNNSDLDAERVAAIPSTTNQGEFSLTQLRSM